MFDPVDRAWFKGRRVLVFGLGSQGGGAAVVRWLAKHGAKIRVTDQKTRGELASTVRQLQPLRVTWALGGHRQSDIQWAEVIIKNNDVRLDGAWMIAATRAGKIILNDAALFFARAKSPVLAVTGTRGKTTTTHLAYDIVRTAWPKALIAGNIPQHGLLDILDRTGAKAPVVAELSSYQLELLPAVRRGPQVAVLTNLGVDHLSRHGTMSAYANIKFNLVRYLRPDDVAVLNGDNPWVRRAAALTKGQVCWYGLRPKSTGSWLTVRQGWVMERRGRRWQRIVPRRAYALAGEHQTMNVLAACAAARAFGVPAANIAIAVRKFSGVPNRQETIRVWRGHQFINDTTATSPDGMLAALQVHPRGVFIVGGTDKRLDFSAMAAALARRHVPLVFLPGTATERLIAALRRRKFANPHRFASSMTQAVGQAIALARDKQPIILSPGAASFGLFKNEFDRGDQFRRVVGRLR